MGVPTPSSSRSGTDRPVPQIPRLRSLLGISSFLKDPMGHFRNRFDEHGDTIRSYFGGMYPAIFTHRPSLIRHVLQKNHRNYQKGINQAGVIGHFLGNGLLSSNGDYWLQQRRLIQPGFHHQRLQGVLRIMEDVVQTELLRLQKHIDTGSTVDIFPEMVRMTFDIIARSIFRTGITEAERELLARNFSVLQEYLVKVIRLPFLKPWFRISGQQSKHEEVARSIAEVLLKYINERMGNNRVDDDLLQMLVDSRYEESGAGMTARQILNEVNILIVAGHETSANALSWILKLLAEHPEAAVRLKREADENLGSGGFGLAQLRKLAYTRQVIEEGLRLYPPAWFIDRVAIDDDEFEGVRIPAGANVAMLIYFTHRDPEYWVDPDQFQPERFSPEARKSHVPFQYLPFGGGPRLCIGHQFAMMEMQVALACFLRAFRPVPVPETNAVQPTPMITLRPDPGIPIRLEPW